MSELYFFHGEKTRKYKRFRKHPELLPFSVRLTGLSGAVKVEAYLKQQQQQKAGDGKETPAGKSAAPEVGKARETAAESESPSRAGLLAGLLQKDQSEGKKNSRRLLNLPDIGLGHLHAVIRSLDQLEGDDEEEDTQRFLFEENKFAAPNLLAQLARLLDYIHERQLEEFEEIRSVSSQLSYYASRVSTPVVPEDEESMSTETIVRRGGVAVSLPDDLHSKLLWNYEELSGGAVYVKRDWQTSSYREQAILQKRILANTSESNLQNSSKQHAEQMCQLSGGIEQFSKVDKSPGKACDTKEVARRKSGQADIKLETTTIEGQAPKQDDVGALTSSDSRDNNSVSDLQSGSVPQLVSSLRRESTVKLPYPAKSKMRQDRFKNFTENKRRPSSQLQIHRTSLSTQNQHLDEDESKLSDVHSSQNMPGQPAVINFSLLSRTCEEKGWIIHPNDVNDLERQTVLEWARTRLQQVIKEKEEMQEKAKECGEDGPVVIRYYGDTQREAALKYKKGVSWAKRWNKQSEEEKRPKFVTTIPDGTSYCYYPSGRVAVCVVNPGPALPGKYTLVYDDAMNSPMLACFTPTGLGCCYHKTSVIRFISTAKFGAVMQEDGKVEQRWKWPLGRLQTSVTVQLNNFITLRCTSQSTTTLYLSCENETAKFPVGLTQGAKTIKTTELGYLQTDTTFTSQAAVQSTKAKPKRKEGRRRKGQKQPKVDVITEEMMEQRQLDLEEKFPERKEIDLDAPWQLELSKLQRKVKGLVFEWMEHYRIAVGITSPLRIVSRAHRRAGAHSARSVPGTLPSHVDKGKGTLVYRSPSAPPTPRAKGAGRVGQQGSARFPARPHSSAESPALDRELRGTHIDVTGASLAASRLGSKAPSVIGSRSPSQSRSPFRCGVIQQSRPVTPPRSGCTVALRSEILGEKDPHCRCDCRRIPLITDLEYDVFITEHVPKTQLVVISITSSVYPDAKLCDSMLDKLYYEKNRNRSIPCLQVRNDPFRLIRYDVAAAASGVSHSQPLLLRRHNAVPGMFLMYIGGRLLFADHIFNGYGNAKKDFLKQITRTRKDALEGKALPADFRLSPTRGRSGRRAAWGGEIGGVKSASSVLTFSPFMDRSADQALTRITSAATTESSATIEIRGGAHSSTSFVNLGLSINSPYPRLPTKRLSGNEGVIPPQNIQSAA